MSVDVAAMQRLAAECWRLEGPYVATHVGDLPWRLFQHIDGQAAYEVRLWRAGDECRAWDMRTLKRDDVGHMEPADLERRVDVHRAAFAPSRVVPESYARVQASPPYRHELDWVVEAPDGRFAAFALCWLDEANGVAELDPGTHPDFRRLGLARAVSIAGLRASGARTGVVYSYGGTVASEPYDSIGLRRQTRHVPFRHRTTLE